MDLFGKGDTQTKFIGGQDAGGGAKPVNEQERAEYQGTDENIPVRFQYGTGFHEKNSGYRKLVIDWRKEISKFWKDKKQDEESYTNGKHNEKDRIT